LVASALDPAGLAQRIDISGLSNSPATLYTDLTPIATKAVSVSEGQVMTYSAYVRGTAGLAVVLLIQARNSGNTGIATVTGNLVVLTGSWQRVTLTSTALPAATTKAQLYFRVRAGAQTAGFVEVDRAQAEISAVATGWKDNGQVSAADISTQAAATTALTARVTQTETGLTSVSGQLTQLNNSVGSMGGDNLLPNSSFDQLTADGTRPAWWRSDASTAGTNVVTQVDSPLALSAKAVRCAVATLANGGYMGLTFQIADGDRPKVTAGQSYTMSVYARLSSASARFAMYVQWINDAGTVISTSQLAETAVGTTFTRLSFTATAPAGAVRAQVFPARCINRSGATADMWVELDNVQLQEGSTLTAYSASVQATATQAAATSAAVDSLTSSVTQQGTTLTSVAARTTTLENAVNSTADGLATKASAAALQTLTNRVTSAEGVNTAQASSITDLQTSVGTIQGALGASGLDPAENATWNFDSTVDGWAAANASITTNAGYVTVTATTADPQLTRSAISVQGALYPIIRAKITRRAGAVGDWDGQLFYVTSGHGFSGSYRKVAANPNLAVGSSAVVEWDMSSLTNGGTDWLSNTITSLRIDLGSTVGGSFDIDWIVVGRVGPAASSRALQSLTSTVTTQGATQTSQSQQIVSLQSSVGGNTAQLQQQATTIADSANKIASSYSVRLALSSGGQYYAAGFGLGLDNSSGALQSSFVVSADRFAVLNTVAGNVLTAPFAVVNGQTFISDAFIQDGSITNAKIGEVIQSNNWVSGQAGWAISKTGYFEMNGNTPGAGRIVITSAGVKVYDQNGTLRVQLGNLG
jgi:hypothetical protein